MGLMNYYQPTNREKLLRGLPVPSLGHGAKGSMARRRILSFPKWVTRDELMKLHHLKRRLTKRTGRQHSLDHIIPVCHPLVCGLTVPQNLRVIPEKVNRVKGNKWNPDQLEINFKK